MAVFGEEEGVGAGGGEGGGGGGEEGEAAGNAGIMRVPVLPITFSMASINSCAVP